MRDGYFSPRVFQVAGTFGGGIASLLLACPRCGRPRGHLLEMPDLSELPATCVEAAARADLVLSDVVGPATERLWAATEGLTWFEASLREAPPAGVRAAAQRARVVKVSAEELDHYEEAFMDGTAALARFITMGADGVRWQDRTSRENEWSPWSTSPSRLDRPPVDTIGAGDAWTAAASSVLAAGGSLAGALDRAAGSAAEACLGIGARGDMLGPGRGSSAWLRDGIAFECGRCELGI